MSNDAKDRAKPDSQDINSLNDDNHTIDGYEAEDNSLNPAEQRIAELEAELASEKDRLLRHLAEFENSRRRNEREREDSQKYAVAKLAGDMVNVADNLRRALDSMPLEGVTDKQMRNLLEGVSATERELLAIFEKWNIQRIIPLGEPFDPNFHNAMLEIPDSGQKPGTVVQVFIPGYKIFDRLLREAGVAVAKGEVKKVDTKV